MKILKTFMVLFVCTIISLNINVGAAKAADVDTSGYKYVGEIDRDEGGFLFWGKTTYTYKLYYIGNLDAAIVKPNKLLTYVNAHTFGNTPKTVYGDVSNAYEISGAISFNSSLGFSIGIDEVVSFSSQKGYGVTGGWSFTANYLQGVSYTPERHDRTGYYVLAGGRTCKMMFWQKYLGPDKLDSQYGYFLMPYGGKVVYTMFSIDNENWQFY